MTPAMLSILGLCLDIVGVFFLSAEAIKLQNLRTLRDSIDALLHERILSPMPKIAADHVQRMRSRQEIRRWYLSHLFAGIMAVALIVAFLPTQRAQIEAWWVAEGGSHSLEMWLWIDVLIFVFSVIIPLCFTLAVPDPRFFIVWVGITQFAFPPTLVFMLLGELLHQTIIWSVKGALWLLSAIDQRTPDGTIGIIGFLLALLGFALQIAGTALGASTGH